MKKKTLLIALAVLAALPVLFLAAYVALARWLLSGTTLRSEINQKPEDLRIEWDEASSTWPGRVTVKNLRIRGSDPNVQWIVILPEARFRYELLPLLSKTFRVTELRPTSIQFRLRQKLLPGKYDPERVLELPPIPGFADPPLRVEGQTLPPPEPNPFTIEVLDVATDAFDDIWVDGFRHRGKAALRGRFRLKPGHRAQIGPASVTFTGGPLHLGKTPVLTETKGKLEATFSEWDVQELKEDKVWRVVTAKADLSGPTEGADFLEGVLDPGDGQRFSGGPGAFALSGTIDKGVASGAIELTAKKGRYTRKGEFTLVGSAEAHVRFADFQLDGGAPDISGSSVKLTDVYLVGSKDSPRGWWGEFEIPSGKLTRALNAKVVLKCRDGRPLVAFLGEGLPKWAAGLLDLDGLSASASVVFSEPRTRVRGLHAAGANFTVDGEYDRRGQTSKGAFLIETGILSIGVQLDDGKAVVRPFGAKSWFEKQRAGDMAAGR